MEAGAERLALIGDDDRFGLRAGGVAGSILSKRPVVIEGGDRGVGEQFQIVVRQPSGAVDDGGALGL